MGNCVAWSQDGEKVTKKCPQVYELEAKVEQLQAKLAGYERRILEQAGEVGWLKGENEQLKEMLAEAKADAKLWKLRTTEAANAVADYEELQAELADYKEVNEDKKRLAREIDIIISGESGAAKQASLCDLVAPIQKIVAELEKYRICDHKGVHR